MAQLVTGYVASGYDPTAIKSKDVTERSETEPALVQGAVTAAEYADKLSRNWAEREKREGKKVWYCPLEEAAGRQEFPTKAKCQAYMAKHFKARIEQAKLERKPKEAYTPQSRVVSPKRTLADFVLPEHADKVMAAQRAAMDVQGLGQVARSLAEPEITGNVLCNMMESLAVQKVGHLSDKELPKATRTAYFRSKRKLYQACVKECKKRGVAVPVV